MKECIRERTPFPDAIANAPTLGIGLEIYYMAFWHLSTTRQIGMTLGPIPWDKIQRYGEVTHLNEEQIDDLHFYIGEMDSVYRARIK